VGLGWIHLAQDNIQWKYIVIYVSEPLGAIKGEEFLDHSSDCQLLKKDFVAWV
jgi:hypothetical protein